MKRIQRVSLIGLGAIGASFGQKLHKQPSVHLSVIADDARIRRYQKDGCVVNGESVNFHYVPPERASAPADLLLVAVKHHHLTAALDAVQAHVGPDTIILSLMNGITSEEIIGERYGMEKMLYGVCVGIDAVREGSQTRYSTMGRIFFGEKINSDHSPRVKMVKEIFETTGIPFEIPEDMIRAMWWKFMANVGINQPSALLGAPYHVFQEMDEARLLMESVLREVIVLGNAARVNLSETDLAEFHKIIATFSPEGKTSMLQDMEAGRKTEVEMLAGTVVTLGKKYGVATPLNQMLLYMIRTRERMNGLD
ncbi:MAG: ketopantoate reductase family protein [Bacillota bacterium]|nr:ketopantoate reductase family protein [Bacillota bacterium]MDW7676914.1 ketopantoate reductase family protein [Bacillota bacterium]